MSSAVTEFSELIEELKTFPKKEKYTDELIKSNMTTKRNAYMIDMEKPLLNLEKLKVTTKKYPVLW